MTKSVFIAVAAIFAVTGCAGGRIVLEGMGSSASMIIAKPKPQNPVVFVDGTGSDAIVVVDQEPIRIKVKEIEHTGTFEPVIIAFTLVTAGYKFAPENSNDPLKMQRAKGTTTTPGPTVCVFHDGDETRLICTYTPKARKANYSYTLRVRNAAGDFFLSDPTVMND